MQIETLHDRWMRGDVELDRVPIVLPQFRGSPPPAKNAAARGAIAGLGGDTGAEDLVLGTFLGLVLQFLDVLELFPDRPETVKVIGPAAGNPLWLQLKADLLNTPLSVSSFPEVVSRGAHAIASGSSPRVSAAESRIVSPDSRRHAQLREWRARGQSTWNSLKDLAP